MQHYVYKLYSYKSLINQEKKNISSTYKSLIKQGCAEKTASLSITCKQITSIDVWLASDSAYPPSSPINIWLIDLSDVCTYTLYNIVHIYNGCKIHA
jgi:hypothetical protein